MKYKHYAPKAQVTILRGDFAKYKEFIKQHTEPGVWALCFDGEGAQLGVPFIEYGKNHDGVTQAHHLFTALRDLDKHGAQVVYAAAPSRTASRWRSTTDSSAPRRSGWSSYEGSRHHRPQRLRQVQCDKFLAGKGLSLY